MNKKLKQGESIDYEMKMPDLNRTYIVRGKSFNKGSVLYIFYDVTKIREAEKEIKKLSTAVEQSANSIVITDLEGNIEYTNPKFTELTGYSAKEVIGLKPRILQAGSHSKEFYRDLWQTIKAGKSWHGEFQNKTKNNIFFWEQTTITPVKDEEGNVINYLAIREDITERKNAELELKKRNDEYFSLYEEYKLINEKLYIAKEKAEKNEKVLRKSENRFSLVAQNMPIMMDAFDEKGNIIFWNKECENVTGFSSEEVINNPDVLLMLYPDENYRKYIFEMLEKHNNSFLNIEWDITCKNGEKKTILWSNIADKHRVPGWHSWAVGIDITDRKKIKMQLIERIKEFKGLYSLLKEVGSKVNLKELLAKLTSEIIPQSMQFPDKVFSEVIINGHMYSDCKNINKKIDHYLKSDIIFKTKKIGELRIGYINKNIAFINKYEQNLTNAYGVALGNIVENYNFYEKLKENEEKYRSLFENITDAFALHKIVVDKNNKPVDYIFIEVNKSYIPPPNLAYSKSSTLAILG